MNHLREVLELAEIRCPDDWDQPGAKLRIDLFRTHAPRAMCFWMGDWDEVGSLAVIPEICKLPFETCWFESAVMKPDGGHLLFGVLAFQHADGICMQGFRRSGGEWFFTWMALAQEIASGGLDIATGDPRRLLEGVDEEFLEAQRTLAFGVRRLIAKFLSALACSNVRTLENCHSPKLQKARQKRGKLPLFSYWTLQLTGRPASRGAPSTGQHASPRLHLRRGHARQFAVGQWTWVQPTVVGDKTLGMVHKDYAATFRPQARP